MIKDSTSYTTIGNETMLTNSETGEAIMLDESGTKIWNYIVEGKDKENIIQSLVNEFPDYEKEIREDVEEVITLLLDHSILGKD